jgi:hypothetical protein
LAGAASLISGLFPAKSDVPGVFSIIQPQPLLLVKTPFHPLLRPSNMQRTIYPPLAERAMRKAREWSNSEGVENLAAAITSNDLTQWRQPCSQIIEPEPDRPK